MCSDQSCKNKSARRITVERQVSSSSSSPHLSSCRETFLNELELLSRVEHANLSSLVAVQLDHLYFIQEHSHFGTLQDYSRTLSNQSAAMEVTFQK